MATSTPSSPYQCPLCLKSFSRQEHLHRHLLSHGSNRPFRCEFCSTSFNRADVRNRHLRNCRRRAQHIVREVPRPSRRRACDRCVRQKRACNSENPCQECLGRDEPCTYLHVQGSVSLAFSVDPSATINGPEKRLSPCEDDVGEPTLSNGAFATTDLMSIQLPTGPVWDVRWPPEPAGLPSCLSHSTQGQGWEACAPPESISMDFTYFPSTWQSLVEDQTIHGQHDLQPTRTGDLMGSFSFTFLANFTSTTGFVNSFDCGTLEERRLVVRSCTTTETNEICSGSGESYPDNVFLAENTSEGSQAVVEAASHIWGFILPDEVLMSSASTQCQQQAQVKPLYTKDWMQAPGEELRNDSITCVRDTGSIRNLNLDLQTRQYLLSDPLTLMTHEIISRIKEVISLKPRNSIISLTWSSLLEEICLRFFSPPNLHKYLELYWACWHPNWPVVHKPTFSPIGAHPILMAAMALVGACMSPDAHDNENARTWFDSVEEMAFNDEDFCDNSRAGSTSPITFDPSKSRRRIQALQAAYAVCLYQNWEGSDRNKRRIRRYRYSTLVAIARDLGLENARHQAFRLEDRHLFEWHQFTIREEFIRTLIYIFLMDTAFVIFNNLPPRMVIKELKMDLVCPEACFQAPTADECFASITSWKSSNIQQRKMSLCSAIETVLGDDMNPSTREIFAELGILNLFAVASALHYLIFQLQSSFIYEPRLAPLRQALANWEQIWLLHASSENRGAGVLADETASRRSLHPCEMWKRVGFMRNAPEFWLLAKIVLERLETDRRQKEVTNSFVDSSGQSVDDLCLRSPVLEKYDETSMGQVNDIIMMFQRLDV